MTLAIGDIFSSKHFKGFVKVLELKQEANQIDVLVVRANDKYHTETWNYEHTEVGFQRKDYFYSDEIARQSNVMTNTLGCENTGCDVMLSISTCNLELPIISDFYFTKENFIDLFGKMQKIMDSFNGK